MKYADLVQFEPIESVVQLREADESAAARQLVSTYVISDAMADRLADLVFPQLQFERPADNKGLLIVGNYGTGKSHLLAVISAIAEHAGLAGDLRSERARTAAASLAGRFKVVRTELGGTTMDFRDFVCYELERALEQWGITFRFPPRDRIPNHKGAFEELMATFGRAFPDQGLLIVVDELLDYLKTRNEQPLILDLNFLREIGEICRDLRFRFVAGVQEMLFDNPKFAFVAHSLQRVKDRFEQVHVARRDVKYVVAERLLKKTADQQDWVRRHLVQFAPFYGGMNERLDEFARLFPVHPDYVDVFERIAAIEKPEVLKTLSLAMRRRLDQDVPADEPGLIAFDDYWQALTDNPAFRTDPEIREVLDCGGKLDSLIDIGYPRGKNRAFAHRIIHGLGVYRLAVGGIETPIGLSAEALRDSLCLFDPLVAELGGEPAEDLRGEVETAVRLITTTANGQFLSATERDARGLPGGQFYLDVKKTVDYDAQIERRAEMLSSDALNRACFAALKQVMECTDDAAVVTGYNIWEHELEWRDRKAARTGYLFFGAPNERSTAQPPRDFYLYFLPPNDPPSFADRKLPDEVYFRLTGADELFERTLGRYGAALALGAASSGAAKNTYDRKAADHLKLLAGWLQEHLLGAFSVTHAGRTRTLQETIKGAIRGSDGARANVRDQVNLAGSVCLAPHFADQAPDYPAFSVLITGANRAQAAEAALRWIRGAQRPQQGAAVLDALELLDGDRLAPERSRYAQAILAALQRKGEGQVVNRVELLQESQGLEYFEPARFRLEPEWVVVVLGALVHSGDVVLALPGHRLDAGGLDALASLPVRDLVSFRHIERPKDWDLPALRALFELLGLAPGLAQLVTQGKDEHVIALQAALAERIADLARARHRLQQSVTFWGQSLLDPPEEAQTAAGLEGAQKLLESLQVLNSPGRLKNLRLSADDIRAQAPHLAALEELTNLWATANGLESLAGYLSAAALALPAGSEWSETMAAERARLLPELRAAARRDARGFERTARRTLTEMQASYLQEYIRLHSRARLGAADDRRKSGLLRDNRLARLQGLAAIELLPAGRLQDLLKRLHDLKSCFSLTEQELRKSPTCPHCHFQPAAAPPGPPAAQALSALDAELDCLLPSWTDALRQNLAGAEVQASLQVMAPDELRLVSGFLESGTLPEPLTPAFVQAVKTALAGLVRVVIPLSELAAALQEGGAPQTPDDLKARFGACVDRLAGGHPPERVRVVVE